MDHSLEWAPAPAPADGCFGYELYVCIVGLQRRKGRACDNETP